MLTRPVAPSRWMNSGAPTTCAFCGKSFVIHEKRSEAVHVGDQYVCNDENCIDGINEQLPQWIQKGRMLS